MNEDERAAQLLGGHGACQLTAVDRVIDSMREKRQRHKRLVVITRRLTRCE